MKPICCNCHFLSKEHQEENTGRVLMFTLNAQEREKAANAPQEMIAPHYSLKCHLGVWDESISGQTQERASKVNRVPRGSSCFFFPYHPAMLFDAARELQKRVDENKRMKRSNFYTRVGLWVAAGALAVNALVAYLKNI